MARKKNHDMHQASPHPGLVWVILLLGASQLLTCCSSLIVEQQRLVSRPNMQFSEMRAFNDPTRISSQLEPGRVATGGAQASVCTTCR